MKGKLNIVFIALLLFQLVASGYMPVMQIDAETEDAAVEAEHDTSAEDSNENNSSTNEETDENEPKEDLGTSDNQDETGKNENEEEIEESEKLENENESEVETPEGEVAEKITTYAGEQSNEFFDFKISEIKDLQGNAYSEGNPLKPDDEFWVGIDWALKNGHSYQAGDTTTFELPEELDMVAADEGELSNPNGEVVATYSITKDGEVTLTFTEFVENNSNVTGWLEIRAELDQDQVQEDGKVVIGPIEDEGEQVLPLDRNPINKTVEKQGQPNKSYNADEIEWTVTINKMPTR